jgi:hypothetical protein
MEAYQNKRRAATHPLPGLRGPLGEVVTRLVRQAGPRPTLRDYEYATQAIARTCGSGVQYEQAVRAYARGVRL